MSATLTTPKTTSGGEIITHLINSTDGTGLHFDGAAGNIDLVTPPDLGTKFSFEFIIQMDAAPAASGWSYHITDFGNGGRFFLGYFDGELIVYSGAAYTTGLDPLSDLKPHHLVLTIDGTAAKLFDNGNEIGTIPAITSPDIDLCTDARLGSKYDGTAGWFDGTIYRARFWNKTLSQAEVTASFENATVPFSDQYGTEGTPFSSINLSSVWTTNGSSTINDSDTFTSTGGGQGVNYPITIGKNYRVTWNISGAAFYGITEFISGSWTDLSTDASGTLEFTASKPFLYVRNDAAGATDITSLSLVEIGVVADYDLAFANPTQSLMVQDRAGAADGTSSATGVVQVTPIEQLNSKAARIGTSAATPADGELLVSGNIQSTAMAVYQGNGIVTLGADDGAYTRTNATSKNFRLGCPHATNAEEPTAGLFVYSTSGGASSVNIGGGTGQMNAAKEVVIYTAANDTTVTGTARLTIDSTGNVGWRGTHSAEVGKLFKTDTDNAAISATNELALYVANAGVRAVHIDAEGNTGVGTAVPGSYYAPAEKLVVHESGDGGITIATGESARGRLVFARSGVFTNDYGSIAYDQVQNKMEFYTTGSPHDVEITSTGGLVEVGGVLKENLLTNSGFDVWSNSTLEVEAVINSDTDGSSYALWTETRCTMTDGGSNLLLTYGSGTDQAADRGGGVFVAGKLYKATVVTADGTNAWGSSDIMYALQEGGTLIAQKNDLSAGTHTVVWECVGNNDKIRLQTNMTGAGNLNITSFKVEEVTPGCVAANALAMDGWTKSTNADIWREHSDGSTEAITKQGSFYALKVSPGTRYDNVAWPSGYLSGAEHMARFASRTVTFGAWVKCAASSAVEIQMSDGVVIVTSTHTGSGNWEWLECTIDVDDTPVRFAAYVVNLDVSLTDFWVSQPMLVFGSAIGSGNYSRPMGEIVWFENRVNSSNVYAAGFSDVAVTTLNTEADSNGKIPKGVQSIFAQLQARDAGSAATSNAYIYTRRDASAALSGQFCIPGGKTNDCFDYVTGWNPCNADGDFDYLIEATGSGTFDAYIVYNGVQLR